MLNILPFIENLCKYVGIVALIITILYILFIILANVCHICTRRPAKWCGGPNTWAVVTGSTDGIGLEYARQLAHKGYQLLLISRNANKLTKVADDIQTSYPKCQVRTLAVDFSQPDIYDTIIANELAAITGEIHVLVNNVGITYPNECPEYFTQIKHLDQFIPAIINVNCMACTRLIAMIMPKMEANGRGIVINMSSFAAQFPTPLLAVYSATKVYIDFLSRALQEEYKHQGIIVQSLLPFYVSTKMTKHIRTSLFIPSAEQYVRSALKTVSLESQTAGFIGHKMITKGQQWLQQVIGVQTLVRIARIHFQELRRRHYANEDLTQFNYKLFFPTKSLNKV